MYFSLLGPFCFGLFVFHLAPGADFLFGTRYFCLDVRFCPRHKFLRLRSGTARLWSRLSFRNELFYIRSGTVRLREPVLCLERKNFLLVRLREPVFSSVWSEILLCMRSGTAQLREPFCLGRHVYCVCGLGPLGSGSLYWSYMRSGTVSLWEPVLYLPKIIVIRLNRPFWIWHMLVSLSFEIGSEINNI